MKQCMNSAHIVCQSAQGNTPAKSLLPSDSMVLCRFIHDILFGINIITKGLEGNSGLLEEPGTAKGLPTTKPTAASKPETEEVLPLQLLIFVTNLSVLLPSSSK